MASVIDVRVHAQLSSYAEHVHLAPAVDLLHREAAQLAAHLRGRTVWMINSTAQGGGVAEMLPKQIAILRELGVKAQWAVIKSNLPAFFDLTKRLHNMIHGVAPSRPLCTADLQLFERVARENAERLAPRIRSEDIVVVHDPQPLLTGALLKQRLGVRTIWRCHIGLAERTPTTAAVWRFLLDAIDTYDAMVFTAPAYVPGRIRDRATIIHPAIDPLSDKNRELRTHQLVTVLCNAGLAIENTPVVTAGFRAPARRLLPDGRWGLGTECGDIGLLSRPIITQISRWDRLKGFEPLLQAFVTLKQAGARAPDSLHRRRLALTRLILAGPDPASVSDDPEGQEVLASLSEHYRRLDPALQEDVALVSLPMESASENALMVNALQRCSTIVVQNSVQEGFGLTATEAMWKAVPIVVSGAHGLRQQVRDGIEGRMVDDPYDTDTLALVLDEMLTSRDGREMLARRAQRRVCEEFLVLCKVRSWLQTLARCVGEVPALQRASLAEPAARSVPEPALAS